MNGQQEKAQKDKAESIKRSKCEESRALRDALDNQLDSGSGLNSPQPADSRLETSDNGGITTRKPQVMSEEQLKAFLEAVQADTGLQEKLKAAGDADAVVAIASAAGFAISAEELKKAQAEISGEELEGATGAGMLAYNIGRIY